VVTLNYNFEEQSSFKFCPVHFYVSTKEYLRISALRYFNLIRQGKMRQKRRVTVLLERVQWNGMQWLSNSLVKCCSNVTHFTRYQIFRNDVSRIVIFLQVQFFVTSQSIINVMNTIYIINILANITDHVKEEGFPK